MSNWGSASKQDLKERLKAELATQDPNCRVINGIVEELEARNPVKEIPIETVIALEKLKMNRVKKPTAWKRLGKIMGAAVLTFALLGIVPSALGKQNVFQTIGRWTKDLFCFGDLKETEFVFNTDHPGLQELYDTVTELDVTQNVVPTWLPDGFEKERIEKLSSPKGITVYAIFTDNDCEIQMNICVCTEVRDVQYQKDENIVDVVEVNGNATYVVRNNGRYCALWQSQNIECSIQADTQEILYKVINSIYRRDQL